MSVHANVVMGVQCTFTCLDIVYIGVQRACRLVVRCGLQCTQHVFCDFLAPGGAVGGVSENGELAPYNLIREIRRFTNPRWFLQRVSRI